VVKIIGEFQTGGSSEYSGTINNKLVYTGERVIAQEQKISRSG
jgi:hypothetical protein